MPRFSPASLLLLLLPLATLGAEISLNGTVIESAETSVLLDPGEPLRIRYESRRLDDRLTLRPTAGTVVEEPADFAGRWRFLPPPDSWHETLELDDGRRRLRVHVFTGEPFDSQRTYIGSYRLGRFPSPSEPIPSLLKVSRANQTQRVSEHFTLGELVSHRPAQWPRYLRFSTALLEQLELVTRVLEAHDKDGSVRLLSAFRTPDHNRAVGGAPRSRHIYGDAADLIVDADNDGAMDDLNDDGVNDRGDIDWLIARLQRAGMPIEIGGIGSYETEGQAGAFLHIDARGRAADWER
ncbi:MAG: D-Ala-D-Ala carboxypeptidase family metallohydrolase [Pseudomonadota bacterium]